MTSQDSEPPRLSKLLRDLQQNEELRHQPVSSSGLDPQIALLRQWQSRRLQTTYADLLDDPQYRPACLFFLSDIYAPRDFSQRDHDLQRLHDFLAKVMPPAMIALLTEIVELNRLSNALDQQLAQVLAGRLGVTDAITSEQYAEGYRLCDNHAERLRQIDLMISVLTEVGQGARSRAVGAAVKLMRLPAVRTGWVELYDYLRNGHAAFKGMRRVQTFVDLVEQREKRILERIFAGHPQPFEG